MATISGGTGMQVTLDAGSNDRNGLAGNLANQITAALTGGALTRTDNTNPSTGAGFFVSAAVNTTIALQPAVLALALTGTRPESVVGSGGQGQAVLAGNGNLTFYTKGGTGTVVTGDGSNLLGTPVVGGGAFTFVTDAGNDTVVAASGNNTVSAGAGANLIDRGSGANLIYSNGVDTIGGGSGTGTDTVIGGGYSALIASGSKNLYFVGGTGAVTVLAGTGSDTVFVGTGGGQVTGGSAGNNRLIGGAGSARSTLFGGGNGDVLFARGSGTSLLSAGAGNETLTGAGSTGNNYFFAGNGSALIGGGPGNDTIFAGSGNATVDGGAGKDLVAIVNGRAGGTVLLNGFGNNSPDQVTLQGYAAGEAARAIAAAGSSNTVVLSDNTRITFGGVSSISSSFFV